MDGALFDHRVRLALNHAIDRGSVWELLDRKDRADDPFPHSPALARKLLGDAGFERGLELAVLTADPDLESEPAFTLCVAQLAEVGVRLNVKVADWERWISAASQGDGHTLFHAGAGVFISRLGSNGSAPSLLPAEDAVRTYLRDLIAFVAQLDPIALLRIVTLLLTPGGLLASVPPARAPTDRRRMQVWMWEDGLESLVVLFAWWPAMTTASRLNTADSIRDLIDGTLDEAVNEGACFERLEIMSHGNTSHIKLGDSGDRLNVSDFDAAGNPTSQHARDLLDALKRAMCPNGRLIFTACNQAPGTTLRNISKYINQAITVSGYAGTGYPDLVPGGDPIPPDLHFQNGSTASP